MWKNVDEQDEKGVAPHPSTAATVDRTGHASDGQTRRRGGRSVVDTEAAAGETGTVVRFSAASGAGTTPHLRACCCRQFNIVNNIIGSGLLSLPWALRECGLFFGLVTMFGICCLNAVTIMVLARCCEMAGAYSYKEIGRRALGPTAGFVSQTIVAGYTLGSTISYIVLIGGARRACLAAKRRALLHHCVVRCQISCRRCCRRGPQDIASSSGFPSYLLSRL